ncbi:PREDICTED: dolichyldiphosphatase 1-like [Amphimedon queenslandica]|uniref:Dolichyldiphosphatase 1 n=1 Tax=Amphimedon queenslandica TaxID=400682 RepID=A0A1X7UW83_AMPQE|nr:PREDICTED: dolichyldiphosphatase 1-like [Amphimedon queenslandica]|eukprot:XP_019852040.1 PREDICTED: dolichyldiphosphatase 1-like [Amphimedon queenslandica]
MAASTKLAISLTHVEYTEGDRVGYLLAWSSLFPIFILISFLTLVAIRRDLFTVFFFTGLLLNESLNMFLKYTIKEPRPNSDISSAVLRVEYGMPSSHAQFMAFFATFVTLLLFVRATLSEDIKDLLYKVIVSVGAWGGAILCAISRVYLGYHTISQTIYGNLVGVLSALIWFSIVHFLVTPYFPKIYYWRLNDFLMFKDFSLIPNCLWYEYTAVRHESRTRLKRKSMHE